MPNKNISMNRRGFLKIAGGTAAATLLATYAFSDKQNIMRDDVADIPISSEKLYPDERKILYLASLAPSGHNTQPWMIKYLAPYHWIVCNDKMKWLPAVDPSQRETILSIGAFIQNIDYAADSLGYIAEYKLLANSNQDEDMVEIRLNKTSNKSNYNLENIKLRRTIRSGFLNDIISANDMHFICSGDNNHFHYIPNKTKEQQWLSELTVDANHQQIYRDDAQNELANWMRLSTDDALKYKDGLTTASMEISGLSGWIVRNLYKKENVLSVKFREQSLAKVKNQATNLGGWLLMTSENGDTASLLETGKRLQRMLLKTRVKKIGVHPMTQILEEDIYKAELQSRMKITNSIQFVLRLGYVQNYPKPVSLRRPIESFIQLI